VTGKDSFIGKHGEPFLRGSWKQKILIFIRYGFLEGEICIIHKLMNIAHLIKLVTMIIQYSIQLIFKYQIPDILAAAV
jgi:hypothetical protein